jgi:cytoskeleton-associated protein 5
LKLFESPKIAPGDFGDMVRILKKVVNNDSNVMNVALAAKCIAALASGLRKAFSPLAASVCFAIACMSACMCAFLFLPVHGG